MGKQTLFIGAKEDFRDLFFFLKTRGGVPLTIYGEEIQPGDPDFTIPGAAFVYFPAHSKVTMALHSSGRSVLSAKTRNHCIEVAEHGAGILDYSLPVSRIYLPTASYPDPPTPDWLIKEYQALARYIQKNAADRDKHSFCNVYIFPAASKIVIRKHVEDDGQKPKPLYTIIENPPSLYRSILFRSMKIGGKQDGNDS